MGKLIKNHWARLIMLTAATCMCFHLHTHPPSILSIQACLYISIYTLKYTVFTNKTSTTRPNRRFHRGLHLAQDLLGLPHPFARRRSQALPRPPDHQPDLRHRHDRPGVAPPLTRRHRHPPIHRTPSCSPPSLRARLPAHVSVYESGLVLSGWHGCIFLGFQRRRGMFKPPFSSLQYFLSLKDTNIFLRLYAQSPGLYLREHQIQAAKSETQCQGIIRARK